MSASVIVATVFVCYGILLWVHVALGVKRLHDRDNSGWWMLLAIVPLGGLWLLIALGFLDGTEGSNRFGPSPKGAVAREDLSRVFS